MLNLVLLTCQALLAMVFAWSAVSKVRSADAFRGFLSSVRAIRVVPTSATRPVGLAVVSAEVIAVLLLVTPPTVGYAFAFAAGLLASLSGAIAIALRRGTAAPCRCFGSSDAPIGARHLVRNGVLLGVCVLGGAAVLAGARIPTRPGDILFGVAVAASVALLVIHLDDIASLVGPGLHGMTAALNPLRPGRMVVTVDGPSMEPTLQAGDRVVVRRTGVQGVRRNDIVLVHTARARHREMIPPPGHFASLIKRVAAVPGDPVPPGLAADPAVPAAVVPPDRLLLVGDNRLRSRDSRHEGFYPTHEVVGVVVRVDRAGRRPRVG